MVRRACALMAAFAVATVLSGTTVSAVSAVSAAGSHEHLDSLPQVASGALPGPAVLYAPRPDAPQLENHRPEFRAQPLMIAGTESYINGEYLYQDYLNDDNGADQDNDGDGAQSGAVGDIVYPTNEELYGNNAADLVELRIARGDGMTLVRFTLNTMREPDAAVLALALDTDKDVTTSLADLPGTPGQAFPGVDTVVTTWGTGAEVTELDGTTTALDVTADVPASQITVEVPDNTVDLTGVASFVVLTGVHDGAGGFAVPVADADETSPGGAAGPDVSGIFNLGPRLHEAVIDRGTPSDELQAFALGAGTAATFLHDLDFDAIRSRATRDLARRSGTMVRIFPSRLDLGGGRATTFPHVRQQLVEYSVRVPEGAADGDKVGLTLYLHALNEWHWTNNANPYLAWVGDDRNALVPTPLNRGPDGFYTGPADYDTFEVWNDLAHYYVIDAERVTIMGTSMGGYGAYRAASQYPDLFAKAVTNVGPPATGIWAPPNGADDVATLTNLWLDNTWNVPFLNQAAAADELVPITGTRAQNLGAPELGIRGFDQLGHRFRYRLYNPAEHLVLSISSDRAVPEFLGDAVVDRDPARVVFRRVPAADDTALGLVSDHAYWIADVALSATPVLAPTQPSDPSPDTGLVTAYSYAKGEGLPATAATVDAGVADTVPAPLSFTEVGREWATTTIDPENRLALDLRGVGSVRVDLPRASLATDEVMVVDVTTDGPAEVILDGAFGDVTVDGARVIDAGRDLRLGVDGDTSVTITPSAANTTSTDSAAPTSPPDEAAAAPQNAGTSETSLPTTGGGRTGLALVALVVFSLLTTSRSDRSRP